MGTDRNCNANCRLYVGNIPYTTTDEDLRNFFKAYSVQEVKIITDRETGRARGFAFVTLANEGETNDAIATLDTTDFGGRRATVNLAEARKPREGGRQAPREDRGRRGRRDDD